MRRLDFWLHSETERLILGGLCVPEWVPIKEDGKYRGEVYLELTWYPRQDVSDHES